MSSGEVAPKSNIPDLPSTIGSGWLQVSVDDPARDKKVIINNLMRELCIADEQERQHGKFAELTIEDVWTLKAFNSNYVKKFIKEFRAEQKYIEMESTGQIRLTDLGRKNCSRYR